MALVENRITWMRQHLINAVPVHHIAAEEDSYRLPRWRLSRPNQSAPQSIMTRASLGTNIAVQFGSHVGPKRPCHQTVVPSRGWTGPTNIGRMSCLQVSKSTDVA
jgi:hypothetical protein